MKGRIHVGTCSWTDPTMVRAWYPPVVRSAVDRLRYYAEHFDTVEVDSTFYGLPSRTNAALWSERTPQGFVFHIKAFGMMTRHAVRPEQLPPSFRDVFPLELDRSGRIVHPPDELRVEVFRAFSDALTPLRSKGKLGVILLQFPPYFVANRSNRDYITMAIELLAPDRPVVEFRHASWVAPDTLDSTLSFLADLGASYVCVDEPRLDNPTVLPPLAAVTADPVYIRFNGRNAATWRARVSSAAERFNYLYSEDELKEWIEPIERLRSQSATTYLMFNNCYADYAPRNAQQMLSLLETGPAPEETAANRPSIED
jgi:uncharacterized protein YecE (DUF72 family)